jgi:hypothetical protein
VIHDRASQDVKVVRDGVQLDKSICETKRLPCADVLATDLSRPDIARLLFRHDRAGAAAARRHAARFESNVHSRRRIRNGVDLMASGRMPAGIKPRDTPGRTIALCAGTLACLLSLLAVVVWRGTHQAPCPKGTVQWYEFARIGEVASVVLAVCGALTILLALRRAPHRVCALLAAMLVAAACILLIAAAAVDHGLTSCFG